MRITNLTWAVLIFGIVSAVFISTMEPTVGLIDSGELALACSEPGIAHPTGYPLYCLLGRCLQIQTGLEPVITTNLLSALAGGAAAAAVFLVANLIISMALRREGWPCLLISAGTAFAFAFSKTFWPVATVTEVYALETAFTFTSFYMLLRWFQRGESRLLFASGLLFGLSFGIHMLTLLFAPAALIIVMYRRKGLGLRPVLAALGFFALGLTIYLYLPIRAACSPTMNFGDPSSLERFIRHVTAWQYRVWMFSRPLSEILLSLKNFAIQLKDDATFASIPFAIVGGVFLFKRVRALLWALLSIIIFDVVYSMNYSIPDIEPYFIPAIVSWFILTGCGVIFLANLKKPLGLILPIAFCFLGLAAAPARWKEMDRSDYYLVEEVAENILALAPRGAIIYFNNWDYYAPAKYLHLARGYRPDVVLLDFELMRRSWYLEQILERYPEIFAESRPQIDHFYSKVKDFEKKRPFSANELEKAWREMHYSIVRKALPKRPVCGTFFGGEMERLFESVPKGGCGVLVELMNNRFIPPSAVELSNFVANRERLTPREVVVTSIYQRAWLSAAMLFYSQGFKDRSAEFLRADIEFFETNWNSYKNLAVILIERERYEEALEVFRKGEPYIPAGSYPQMIYDDLEKRIRERDSLKQVKLEAK